MKDEQNIKDNEENQENQGNFLPAKNRSEKTGKFFFRFHLKKLYFFLYVSVCVCVSAPSKALRKSLPKNLFLSFRLFFQLAQNHPGSLHFLNYFVYFRHFLSNVIYSQRGFRMYSKKNLATFCFVFFFSQLKKKTKQNDRLC